ncbi:MAG: hypothetical protein RLO21_12940 [Nitratireductor sp.]
MAAGGIKAPGEGIDIALMVSLSNHEGGAVFSFPENARKFPKTIQKQVIFPDF